MDRSAAFEARSRALDAALAFPKRDRLPHRRIEAAVDKSFVVVMYFLAAMFADQSDKPLRQDTVQRRDEVVGVDTHVEKTAEHVNHIVGVHSGEHQVPGKR